MSDDGLQRVKAVEELGAPFELAVHNRSMAAVAGAAIAAAVGGEEDDAPERSPSVLKRLSSRLFGGKPALGDKKASSADKWRLAAAHLHPLARKLDEVRARRRKWMPASFPLFDIQAVELPHSGGARVSFLFDLLVADAASLHVLMAELNALYTAPSPAAGLQALPPVACSLRQHALAKQAAAASPAGRHQKRQEDDFWEARLKPVEEGGLPPAPQLPLLAAGGGGGGLARLSHKMPRAQWDALQAQIQRQGLTPTAALVRPGGSPNLRSAAERAAADPCHSRPPPPPPHTCVLDVHAARRVRGGALLLELQALHDDDGQLRPRRRRGAGGRPARRISRELASSPPTSHSQVVGQLADVMLVEVDLRDPSRPFVEAARAIGEEAWRALEYSTYTSGVDVMQRLNERDGAIGRATSPFVFASVLGVGAAGAKAEEAPPPPADAAAGAAAGASATPFGWFGGVRPVPHSTALDTPQVHLDHQAFTDVDGALLLNWDYAADLFPVTADGGLAEVLFDVYTGFLGRLADADPAAWDAPPDLVPRAHVEQQRRLQDSERDDALLASLEPLHAPFFDEARLRRRDAPAVVGADGALSFAQLADAALYWGARIQQADTSAARMPVPVLLDKGCAQVVAVLAALAAGCAYVPINLHQPPGRVLKILRAVECAVALVPPQLPEALAELQFPDGCTPLVLRLDEHAQPGAAPPLAAAAAPPLEKLGYIIFTSGSTGEPKGVAISHHGASNTCKDINQRWRVGEGDAVLALASLSFDLSVYDLFGVLAGGGRLVMPDPGSPDPEMWLRLLEEQRVTVWNTAPPVMVALLESLRADGAARARFAALPLRLVMLSGDFCPLWVPTQLRELLGAQVEVFTLGGATEASIWSCWYHVQQIEPGWRSIPYGGPLANQQLYVLDSGLQLTPKLVPGEICIGGDGLAVECAPHRSLGGSNPGGAAGRLCMRSRGCARALRMASPRPPLHPPFLAPGRRLARRHQDEQGLRVRRAAGAGLLAAALQDGRRGAVHGGRRDRDRGPHGLPAQDSRLPHRDRRGGGGAQRGRRRGRRGRAAVAAQGLDAARRLRRE